MKKFPYFKVFFLFLLLPLIQKSFSFLLFFQIQLTVTKLPSLNNEQVIEDSQTNPIVIDSIERSENMQRGDSYDGGNSSTSQRSQIKSMPSNYYQIEVFVTKIMKYHNFLFSIFRSESKYGKRKPV